MMGKLAFLYQLVNRRKETEGGRRNLCGFLLRVERRGALHHSEPRTKRKDRPKGDAL